MTTEMQRRPDSVKAGDQTVYAGFWSGAWRRYKRNLLAVYGLVFVSLIVVVAVLTPQIAPYPYDEILPERSLETPSWQFLFGTDELGRDVLSRIMYGARPMLIVGIFTQVAALMIGVPLGLIAGYHGGVFDWIIQRLIDFFASLPWYLVVLYLVMMLRPSMENLILALVINSWVGPCRVVRGLAFSIREEEYIEATRALGLPTWRIIVKHILPQAAPLFLWIFAAGIPQAVFAEAGLSFLGMGIRPPEPSWGRMLGEAGQWWIYRPHMFVFPGLMISLSVLAFQGVADGLRSALDVNVNV